MTKNRLFTFLILSLIGGFVLSAPDTALAKARNTDKEKKVTDFMNEYGIKKTEQGKNYLNRQDTITKAKDEFNKELENYKQKRETLQKNCAKTYAEAVQNRWKKLVETAKNAGKEVVESDNVLEGYWNVIKGECKIGWAAVRLAWTGIGGGFAVDKLTDAVTNEVAEWILGDDVAYTAQVNHIKSICESANKTQFEKEIEELMNMASRLEDLAFERNLLEAKGYGDEIYIHCPGASDTSCVADEGKDNYEQKCCTQFIVNTEKNTIMSVRGASAGCPPLSFKLWEARSCLFCPLFDTIFDTIQTASTTAYGKFAEPLSTLVLIGLAIWIAFMVLTNVSSLTKQDAPKFLNDLFKASFKVVIAFFLLRYSSIIYGIIIGPLLKAGLDFGATFLSQVPKESGMISGCKYIEGATTSIGGVLPSYLYDHLMCFIEAVEYELGTTQAIGSSLMCVSRNAASTNLLVISKALPNFTMMLQGVIIWVISFILSIAFAFYLIDATVSLGIFGVLLPFLILCWPFKPTNGYFTKGVGVFMNSWFVYVFMGIVTNITLQLIGQALSGGMGGFDAIKNAINSNHVKTLQSLLDIGFSGFLILLASCVFAIKLMQKVEGLAGQFSGGLGLGIGSKIGGLAAGAATNIAKTGVGMVAGAAKGAYNAQIWEEKDADGNYTGKFRSAHDKVSAIKNKAIRKATGAMQRGADRLGDGIGRIVYSASRLRRSNRRNPSA